MSEYLINLAGQQADYQNKKDELAKSNKEKEYNLYFSKITYRKYYHCDNSYVEKCELHGDELKDEELIEIKWDSGLIEKHLIYLFSENSGRNKRIVPHILKIVHDTNVRICVGELLARRIYEPKK